MKLPKFKHYPNPLSAGSFEKSSNVCKCCDMNRGIIYIGPIYTDLDEELNNSICPWCIADGLAHRKFGAEFIDSLAIGNYGTWDRVPKDQIEEITYRTPGYSSWQESRWWTHCKEAAEFLGFAGKDEAIKFGSEFLNSIRLDAEIENDDDWNHYLNVLDKEKSPTAYIFRCKKCGKYGGYSDSL